jgi:hypothetical protein
MDILMITTKLSTTNNTTTKLRQPMASLVAPTT